MPYVTKQDMVAVVPADVMTVALDDQHMGDDVDNVWPVIAAAAQRRIDGILGARYAVPFADPLPALVHEAAVIFAAHMLYLRRQAGDNNPFAKEAAEMVARLQRIADGLADLEASETEAAPVAITEPALTHTGGRLMV